MKVVLASASERRQDLLSRVVDKFTVMVSEFDEDKVLCNTSIAKYVSDIALGKALDVAKRTNDDAIIIAADTVVTINNKILGKPLNKEDAFETLKLLSGRWHIVYTSIVLINTKTKSVLKSTLPTDVKFSVLSEAEIKRYIETDEPMDKAGSYGIQGKGGVFVEQIKGCYYNVVGLSLNKLNQMLKEITANQNISNII